MPDTARFPEQLGIRVYARFEKYKFCRQIRKLVLANKRTKVMGFSGWSFCGVCFWAGGGGDEVC